LAPKVETNQTLAELANLLGAQSCPADQNDATAVERDVIHILRLTGPTAAPKHLKPGSRGHCLISPLEALEAVYKYRKANLGMFVKPALLLPEEGWLAKFDSSQVNFPKNADCAAKNLGFQAIRQREAWINLMRRRNLKPDAREDRQWQKDSKSWKLLQQAVDRDLIRPSAFPWTVFAPPAL